MESRNDVDSGEPMVSGDPELLSNDLVEFNADDRTEVGYSITPPEVPKPETPQKVAPRNVMTREEPAQYRIVKHPPGGASSICFGETTVPR